MSAYFCVHACVYVYIYLYMYSKLKVTWLQNLLMTFLSWGFPQYGSTCKREPTRLFPMDNLKSIITNMLLKMILQEPNRTNRGVPLLSFIARLGAGLALLLLSKLKHKYQTFVWRHESYWASEELYNQESERNEAQKGKSGTCYMISLKMLTLPKSSSWEGTASL